MYAGSIVLLILTIWTGVYVIGVATKGILNDMGAAMPIAYIGIVITGLTLLLSFLTCLTKIFMNKCLAICTLSYAIIFCIPLLVAGALLKMPIERE